MKNNFINAWDHLSYSDASYITGYERFLKSPKAHLYIPEINQELFYGRYRPVHMG